jgi:membrane carboxypeptidase/penicillin-binding protein
MPAGWMSTFSIPGLNYAIKSGTSDMKIQVNGREELRPRDGWLAMYTPDRVAIFWSGNADGSAMNANAFGGRLNAPAWKAFISQVRSDGLIENQLFPRRGMVSLTIDKYSGLLPADDTPLEHQIETMAYADKRPRLTATSRQSIEYDTSCNGQISPLTPLFEVSRGYIADPVTSFMPDQRDVPQIREWFSTQT